MISSAGVLTPSHNLVYGTELFEAKKSEKWYYHVYNTTTACIIYLAYFMAVMTSLRQPVGVWHEIVIQARGDTTCLSMDSITYRTWACREGAWPPCPPPLSATGMSCVCAGQNWNDKEGDRSDIFLQGEFRISYVKVD